MKFTIYRKTSVLDVAGFIASSDAVKPPLGYKAYAVVESLRIADAVKQLSFKTDEPTRRSPQVVVSKILNALVCTSIPFTVKFYG